jgi:hypothetical protein
VQYLSFFFFLISVQYLSYIFFFLFYNYSYLISYIGPTVRYIMIHINLTSSKLCTGPPSGLVVLSVDFFYLFYHGRVGLINYKFYFYFLSKQNLVRRIMVQSS